MLPFFNYKIIRVGGGGGVDGKIDGICPVNFVNVRSISIMSGHFVLSSSTCYRDHSLIARTDVFRFRTVLIRKVISTPRSVMSLRLYGTLRSCRTSWLPCSTPISSWVPLCCSCPVPACKVWHDLLVGMARWRSDGTDDSSNCYRMCVGLSLCVFPCAL